MSFFQDGILCLYKIYDLNDCTDFSETREKFPICNPLNTCITYFPEK